MKTFGNIVTEGLSGRIQQLVFRQRFGMTIVAASPQPSRFPPSTQQAQTRINFKAAARYAKAVLADAATAMAYQRKAKLGRTAYNVAIADFFKPPTIGAIDHSHYSNQPGSYILAEVADDFKVAAVEVRIANAAGQIIEVGPATLTANGLQWKYDVTVLNGSITGNSIAVIATDMPGHSITKTQSL